MGRSGCPCQDTARGISKAEAALPAPHFEEREGHHGLCRDAFSGPRQPLQEANGGPPRTPSRRVGRRLPAFKRPWDPRVRGLGQ